MTEFYLGEWDKVILNIILFSIFIFFTSYKKKNVRLPSSIYLAFIVDLYLEMFGIPLTVYFLAWLIGFKIPATAREGKLLLNLLPDILYHPLHVLTEIVMVNAGLILVLLGWRKIFKGKGNELVTTGVYRYIRHPQYLGFILTTFGMMMAWPTLPTVIMWPVLAFSYYRLAKEEDKEMEKKFGRAYQKYKHEVPMFFPRISFSRKKMNRNL